MKFLFVEDEAELLELYEMLLEDMDVEYSLASNGEEALQLLASNQYDAIFSDIRMPKMDGFQLLEAIKAQGIDVSNFIFVTAHVDISEDEVKQKGADDILYKPLGHRILKEYIAKIQN